MRSVWWVLAGVLLSCATAAYADDVTMQLTGPTSSSAPHLAGVYTDPYAATVAEGTLPLPLTAPLTGVTVQVLCDDFSKDVNIGDVWHATSTSLGNLSLTSLLNLKFDSNSGLTGTALQNEEAKQYSDYMAAAYLATEIMGLNQADPTQALEAEQMSFALWGIFDSAPASPDCSVRGGPLTGCWITGTDLAAANQDLSNAIAAVQGLNPSVYSNVYIYTPNPLSASQEYIVVTPEPATYGIFAMALAGVLCGVLRYRKSRQYSA